MRQSLLLAGRSLAATAGLAAAMSVAGAGPDRPARPVSPPAGGGAAGTGSAAHGCIRLAALVPAQSEMPAGWTIEPGGGEDSTATAQGISLLLDKLRRSGVIPLDETRFRVVTPQGPFVVGYALLPRGVDAEEALPSAVPGSGVAARMSGRVLFMATTTDRAALQTMADRFVARLAAQLRDAAASADESRDPERFADCAADYLAAFPDHCPAHLMLAEQLLFKMDTPRAAEALPHLEKALSPDGTPPLSGADRTRAFYDRGVAQSLLGHNDEAIQSLKKSEEIAPSAVQRADAQYQLAAVFAMAGSRAQSLAALRRCFASNVEAGRPAPSAAAAADVAFVSLHDDAEFRALVGAPASAR